MKKILITFCCLISIVCILLFAGCGLLDDSQPNSNEIMDNAYDDNLSQYFNEDCPISFTKNSIILDTPKIQLLFENNSDKTIIAYEAILILYNVYGERLIYSGHNSPYHKITEAPRRFETGTTDLHYFSISSKAYYAEIYIYYVLFDDQTSWGCRTNITVSQILELGTKYKIERYKI